MNYDKYKLSSPLEREFCEHCGDPLNKFEEIICEPCENKLKEEEENEEEE